MTQIMELCFVSFSFLSLYKSSRSLSTIAIVGTMRSAVGAVMAAVFVAILTNKVPAKIAEFVPVAAVNGGLPESSLTELFAAINIGTDTAFSAVPGITPEIEVAVGAALSDAYAAAYAYVYYAAVAVGVVGLIACIYVRDYDALFTGHVPRKIYASGESETPNLKIDGASQEKIALDTAEKVVVCETA